jgi:threonine/homoserine/homoserine lactone efflux protein
MVTLSPGPNVLLVIKNAIKYGYSAAGITIFCNLICQLIIITLVAWGAGGLLVKSPLLFLGLKSIGGAYLIYLGLTGLFKKDKDKGKQISEKKNASVNSFSYFSVGKEAFLVSASNPKTIIFLSAFLPQFVSTDASIAEQFTVMFFTICLIVMSVHLIYSYIAKNINNKWSGLKTKQIFSKISNSAFIAFGCGVILSHRSL